jgi:2-methylisocitrate lyase-like PEP mutase family enzyme
MSSQFQKFKSLHQSDKLFVLPNAWDPKSAQMFQEKNYPAVATSSAAVANSLGYEDGEGMPFQDYFFVIKRILSSVKIPLTVDLEMGYGETKEQIFGNVQKIAELGVVGINIEDSVIKNSKRSLQNAEVFARTIDYLKNSLVASGLNVFINVRCDTYILGLENKQEETVNRLKIYSKTGADGIFLPCIVNEGDIAQAIANTKLPLNVMCLPGLPDFAVLNRLGVKRVSMGPFMFQKVYAAIGQLSQAIVKADNFSAILS